MAEPAGLAACPAGGSVLAIFHTSRHSAMSETDSILARLMAVIEARRASPSERSYTNKLLAGGVDAIGAKITEEAAEVVEAAAEAGEAGRQHLVREAADLIYHLFVMLGFKEIPLAEVEAELARRFGISGLDEKAARKKE
jgi:phosphoribosyl-ATP pyrophosphohydrolase